MKKFGNRSNFSGELIRSTRQKKKLKKVDVCRELELIGVAINPDELYRIESCKMVLKDFELVALCYVLDIDFNDLKKFYD